MLRTSNTSFLVVLPLRLFLPSCFIVARVLRTSPTALNGDLPWLLFLPACLIVARRLRTSLVAKIDVQTIKHLLKASGIVESK